jgi:hypothetical protein
MACLTCDHTMQGVGAGMSWCPRCGRIEDGTGAMNVPSLVGRCRQFEREFRGSVEYHMSVWVRLGIHEAVNMPDDRRRL